LRAARGPGGWVAGEATSRPLGRFLYPIKRLSAAADLDSNGPQTKDGQAEEAKKAKQKMFEIAKPKTPSKFVN
jgi:hypothetical protein